MPQSIAISFLGLMIKYTILKNLLFSNEYVPGVSDAFIPHTHMKGVIF